MTPRAVSNPSQAINLGGVPYAFNDAFTLINLFKGGDGWSYYDAKDQRVVVPQSFLDEKGWLKDVPQIDGKDVTVLTNSFYTKVLPAGSYILEWEGEGSILPRQNYEVIGPNKIRINYEAIYKNGTPEGTDDGITLRIESTDPNNSGNYIRNVKLYDEKYADLQAMGETYNPEWFQQIDDFRVIRTLGMQEMNFSDQKNWNPAQQSMDKAFVGLPREGAPFEMLVDLANQTKSDLWLNIPHQATDDYVRKAAQYVRDNLADGLRVYVEYSNEYFTKGFDQHQYFIDMGKKLFGDVPFANTQAYAARSSQVATIFADVFGKDNPRLFPTVTIDNEALLTGEIDALLNAPAWVAKGGQSPLQAGLKHLATDGYFLWFNTDPATDALVDSWIAQGRAGYGLARDYLIKQIKEELAPSWAKGREIAEKYGLKFGVYEGGALLLNGGFDTPANELNPKYTAFNKAFQLTDEMKDVYKVAAQEWSKYGSSPFAWFADVGRPNDVGDYGLWNAPDYKPEPRTQAIIDANIKGAPWLKDDVRPASTFENGLYDAGTDKADTITGTKLDDRLYGLKGDDVLNGLAGDDVLVGGLGKDKLLGGAGNDELVGGAGADQLFGGDGFDFASYRTSEKGVKVDLSQNRGLTADAFGDVLSSIEGLIGSKGRDQLTGDAKDNWIDGGAGNDTLRGGGGADRLLGGKGDDTLTGGAGRDIFFLGPGKDVVTDWSSEDKLAITSAGWSFGSATNLDIAQVGKNTQITLLRDGETWSLTLLNTKASTITYADDFLYS